MLPTQLHDPRLDQRPPSDAGTTRAWSSDPPASPGHGSRSDASTHAPSGAPPRCSMATSTTLAPSSTSITACVALLHQSQLHEHETASSVSADAKQPTAKKETTACWWTLNPKPLSPRYRSQCRPGAGVGYEDCHHEGRNRDSRSPARTELAQSLGRRFASLLRRACVLGADPTMPKVPLTWTFVGGGDRNRTGVRGFAGPCLNHSATPPSRRPRRCPGTRSRQVSGCSRRPRRPAGRPASNHRPGGHPPARAGGSVR